MTISEFVKALETIKEQYGDIPVAAASMMGGHYEASPEVEEVTLDMRVGKRTVQRRKLCVVVG